MNLTTKLKIDTSEFLRGINQSISEGKKLGDAIKDNLSNIKIGFDDKPATNSFKNLETIANKTGENVKTAFEKAFNFNNIVNSVNLISDSMSQVVSVGVEFESSLAAVGAITGFTGDGLATIGQKARELSVAFGGSATSQLQSFQGILSKLGPDIAKDSEALALFGKNVNLLSAASGDDAATSMNAITDAMLQLGLASGTPMEQARNSTDVINALAAGAQVGAAEIPQVANALVAAGVAAKGANLDLVDTNAAIQVLALGGKTGSEAGTALRNVLGLLQKASGPAAAAMDKLGTSSGELGKLLTTEGLDVALAKVKEGMNNLGTDVERNSALMDIFGMENAAAAGILIDNTSKFAEFSDGIRAGMQGVGSATEQANIRLDTAGAKIEQLKARVSDVFISISQTLGQGFTTILGAFSQLAPMLAGLSGLKMLIPQSLFDNAISGFTKLGRSILYSTETITKTAGNMYSGFVTETELITTNRFKSMGKSIADVFKNPIASLGKLKTAFKNIDFSGGLSGIKSFATKMISTLIPSFGATAASGTVSAATIGTAYTAAGTAGTAAGTAVTASWSGALAPVLATVAVIGGAVALVWGSIKLIQGYSKTLAGESAADAESRIKDEQKVLNAKRGIIKDEIKVRQNAVTAINNFEASNGEGEAYNKSVLELSQLYPGVISASKTYEQNLKALNDVRNSEVKSLNESKTAYMDIQDLQLKLDSSKNVNNFRKASESLTKTMENEFSSTGDNVSNWLFGTSNAKQKTIEALNKYKTSIANAKNQVQLDEALNLAQSDLFNSKEFSGMSEQAKLEMVKGYEVLSNERYTQIEKAKEVAKSRGTDDYEAFLPSIPEEKINEKQSQFARIIKGLLAVVTFGVSEIFFNWGSISDFISKTFTTIYNVVSSKLKPIIDFFSYFGAVFIGIGKSIASTVADWIKAFGSLMLKVGEVIGSAIWKTLTNTFNILVTAIKNIATGISELASDIYNNVTSAFQGLFSIFSSAYSYVSPFLDTFINPIIDAFNWISETIGLVIDKIVGFASSVKNAVGGFIDELAKVGGFYDEDDKKDKEATKNKSDRSDEYNKKFAKNATTRKQFNVEEVQTIINIKKVYEDLNAGQITADAANSSISKRSFIYKSLGDEQAKLVDSPESIKILNTEYEKYVNLIKSSIKEKKGSATAAKESIFKEYEIIKKYNEKQVETIEKTKDLKEAETGLTTSASSELVYLEKKLQIHNETRESLVTLASKYNLVYDEQKTTFTGTNENLTEFNTKLLEVSNTITALEIRKPDITYKAKIEPITDRRAAADLQAQFDKDMLMKIKITYGESSIDAQIEQVNYLENEWKRATQERFNLEEELAAARNEKDKSTLKSKIESQKVIELQGLKELEQAKINLDYGTNMYLAENLKNLMEKKREIELAELLKTFEMQKLAAGKNNDELLKLDVEYQKARQEILNKYDTDPLKKFGQTVGNSFNNLFTNLKFDIKPKDNGAAVKQVEEEMKTLDASYRNNEISYSQYMEKMNDLDNKRMEITQNTTNLQAEMWRNMNKEIATSLQNIATEMQNNALEIIKSGGSIGDALTSMALGVVAQTAASVASGKNAIKSLLIATLDGLQAMVPVWSAQILAGSLATPQSILTAGGWGLAQWVALTALITTAVQAAKAGVQSLKFEKGGLNKYGGFGDGLLKRETTITAGERGKAEYIINNKSTMKNLNLLEHINNGKSGVDFYKKELLKLIDYKRITGNFDILDRRMNQIEIEHYKQNNQELVKGFSILSSQLTELNGNVKSQKIESYQNYNVNVKNNVIKATQVALNRG